jgi:ubiquinone/menaquinone biosynthesis C-methylase UbiE
MIWAMAIALVATLAAPGAAQTSEQASGKAQQDRSADTPPPLTHYKGRQIAQTMHYLGAAWLTREERNREEDTQSLLKALKVKPGQTVCDMGCGNGYYTLELARLVGARGKVLAVDIQPEMLSLLNQRAAKAGIDHIEPILGTLIDPKLPAESLDLILLVDVYHEFSHPEHMLRAMRKSLKPNGRLVLVEFRLEDPEVPIKLLHKMSKQQVLKELPPNGFKLVEQFDELPWQHVLFFQRDETWKEIE